MRWFEIDKGDPRGRVLADRHYTRISVGHPMWTRPGWNFSLYAEQQNGRAAVFNWWRPKWESGLLGTARKDKLKAIECTIFRNETRFRSSDLIREAVSAVLTWKHALDVEWSDGLISGVSSVKTAGGRAAESLPGKCFLEAGWSYFLHSGKNKRADKWLFYTDPLPAAEKPVFLGRAVMPKRVQRLKEAA